MTWNCASLFGFAPRDELGRKRYWAKIDRVVGLAMSHDVVFLQEVHGCEGDLSSLGCYIPNHFLCGSFCPSTAAGGVLTIVHPRLRQRYGDCWSMRAIHQGRATVVDLVDYREGGDVIGGRHDPLSLCCSHIWTVWEKRGFLVSLRFALPCGSGSVVFVAGGFNFPVDGEGRRNVSTDRVIGGSDSAASHFDCLFDDLTEIAQGRPTRRRSEGGTMTVLSRIDRIYSNLPPGEVLARSACAATLGKLASQCELSDHVPVVARICGSSVVSGYRPFVPDWVLSLSCFPDRVRDLAIAEGVDGPGGEDLAPFEKLKELKGVIVKAARRAAEEAKAGECDSPSACLHWASRAKGAVRARDLDRLRDNIGRAPRLAPFFDCGGGLVVDSHALQLFCHSCVRDEIDGQIKELKESELPGGEKSAKRNRLHARLSSWSPKGRRVSGVAVLGKGGGVSDDPFGDIKDHWQKIFNNSGGSDAAADALGSFVQQCPDGLEPISREEFCKIREINRGSAPGPDGVSYRAWKACGREAHDVLYDCYLKIMRSGTAPAWCNSARMVFIPKADEEECCESVATEPGDLRPLSPQGIGY